MLYSNRILYFRMRQEHGSLATEALADVASPEECTFFLMYILSG